MAPARLHSAGQHSPAAMYPETRRQTPNISANRRNERLGVVFHHTAGSYQGAVEWLCNSRAAASAHVVIARTGERTILAHDVHVTWHAGQSSFRGRTGCNAFMLGVEFELTIQQIERGELLTDAQIQSALEWLAPRWAKYGWTMDWMTDHRQVSPGRKVDLSPANWARLRAAIEAHFRRPALGTTEAR